MGANGSGPADGSLRGAPPPGRRGDRKPKKPLDAASARFVDSKDGALSVAALVPRPCVSAVAQLRDGYLQPALTGARAGRTALPAEMVVLCAEYAVAHLSRAESGAFVLCGDETDGFTGRWQPEITIRYDCHSGGPVTGTAKYPTATHAITGFVYPGAVESAARVNRFLELRADSDSDGDRGSDDDGGGGGDFLYGGVEDPNQLDRWGNIVQLQRRGSHHWDVRACAATAMRRALLRAPKGAKPKHSPAAAKWDPFAQRALYAPHPDVWALQYSFRTPTGVYTYSGVLRLTRGPEGVREGDACKGVWHQETGVERGHGAFDHAVTTVQRSKADADAEADAPDPAAAGAPEAPPAPGAPAAPAAPAAPGAAK